MILILFCFLFSFSKSLPMEWSRFLPEAGSSSALDHLTYDHLISVGQLAASDDWDLEQGMYDEMTYGTRVFGVLYCFRLRPVQRLMVHGWLHILDIPTCPSPSHDMASSTVTTMIATVPLPADVHIRSLACTVEPHDTIVDDMKDL